MAAPGSQPTAGHVVRFDGGPGGTQMVEVPVEAAINIVYATLPYAVMMATPADLEDFVVGFSTTEGIVEHPGEIRSIGIGPGEGGIVARVALAPAALRRHMARRRTLAGRTGCGICGIERLDQLPMATRAAGPAPPVGAGAIQHALAALEANQPLHQATRAVHAAAWCDAAGRIVLVREDVGRHNALDKLIGACLRAGRHAGDGFLVITSRCSFEMVEKAAVFGAAALVAISAPTSLAIERARALGITLVGVARRDGAIAFTDAATPVP